MATRTPDPRALSTRTEFADALTELREQAHLTVRELARRLDARPATLGGYFSGRHLPSTGQAGMLSRLLRECGVNDPEDMAAWIAATNRVRASADRRAREFQAPYRGLASYEAEDARLFFGRDREIERLIELTRDPRQNSVAVVGSSGSGKSSVLRAGLVAAIRSGRLNGSHAPLRHVLLTPEASGGQQLAAALQGLAGANRDVVIVDQMEQLFTSRFTPAQRAEFLGFLEARPQGTVLVFGLRADFYTAAAREPALLPALQDAQVLIAPLDRDDLNVVITGPATEVGLRLEPGFTDVVLADFGHASFVTEPRPISSLPLLAHALLATWQRSSGGRLTIADYRATGGIGAAIELTAEHVFASLDDVRRRTARALFLRLVTVDEVAVTRRRVTGDELDEMPEPSATQVAQSFVEARLLTASAEGLEMSHEALLTAWPRLREWIADGRDQLWLRHRITDNASDWEQSDRDEALLLRGSRLEAAVELLEVRDLALTAGEREYLEQSTLHVAREQSRDLRRIRRTRQSLLAVAVLAVVAIILASVSFVATRDAQRERLTATVARDNALSRQVAAQATQLQGADPSLAEQLALVAYRIAPTDAARAAVVEQSGRPIITRVLGSAGPTALAYSAKDREIAVSHANDGSVHLYGTRTESPPTPISVLPGGGSGHQIFAVAFSPDGRFLATGGQDRTVTLWDIAARRHPVRLRTLATDWSGAVQSLTFRPDGRELVGASAGPHPVLGWAINVSNGNAAALPAVRGVPATATIQAVAFDSAGTTLAAAGSSGTLLEWRHSDPFRSPPQLLRADPTSTVTAVTFAPRTDQLFSGDKAGLVTSWSSATRQRTKTFRGSSDGPIDVLAISPDGRDLAAGSADDQLEQWDVDSGQLQGVVHNPGPVTGVQFASDGATIMSTAADGTLRLARRSTLQIPAGSSVFALSLSRNGKRLAVGTNGDSGDVRVYDVSQPTALHAVTPPMRFRAPSAAIDGTAALSPDGSIVAAGNGLGQVGLWDIADPAHPHSLGNPFPGGRALVESLAFSPDGRTLAVASDDHEVSLWNVSQPTTPRLSARMGGRDLMLGVAFSPDGHLVAGANADDSAYVWNVSRVARPRLIARLRGFESYVYGVAFDQRGDELAATSSDHTTRVYRVRSDSRVRQFGKTLIGPTDYVYTASFDSTGHHVAVGSNDSTVRVYDVTHNSSVPQATLDAVGAPVFAVAYSPDGRSLYAAGRSSTVIRWSTDVAGYAKALCPLAGDPVTRSEWALYVPGARYDPPCRRVNR